MQPQRALRRDCRFHRGRTPKGRCRCALRRRRLAGVYLLHCLFDDQGALGSQHRFSPRPGRAALRPPKRGFLAPAPRPRGLARSPGGALPHAGDRPDAAAAGAARGQRSDTTTNGSGGPSLGAPGAGQGGSAHGVLHHQVPHRTPRAQGGRRSRGRGGKPAGYVASWRDLGTRRLRRGRCGDASGPRGQLAPRGPSGRPRANRRSSGGRVRGLLLG
mmetsp:Transcript_76006/g.211140  ORF Transcript_76006/g.211140 Transcript_76006/m.211140 type:complete len:216 (+) Transcript_76006:269-916(+)